MSAKKQIKNVIFDVGNVIVKWSPFEIIKCSFDDYSNIENHINNIFKNVIWDDLNLGKISEVEAIEQYCNQLNYSHEQLNAIFKNIKYTQTLIDGTLSILESLHKQEYKLYVLSNNIIEIVKYLKNKYTFWSYFDGVVISADIGLMKPNLAIFKYILNEFDLKAQETIFIDDHLPNTIAAKNLEIKSIQFDNANQCIDELRSLKVNVS